MHPSCYFVLISLMIVVSACSNLEPVEATDEFGNIVKYERDKDTYAKEGWYYRNEPSGAPIEAAQYENDTLHGLRILFYGNGDTSIVEHYTNGNFDGPYRMYFENKQLKQSGKYAQNIMVGQWELYYDNGQLKEAVQFENGVENGPFIEYHENGKLAAEGAYKDGDNEHGELKIYDENGALMRTMDCELGRCATTWLSESEKEKKATEEG